MQLDISSIFNPAYLKGASPMNSINGFRVAGIWPYNRNVFQDSDFAPASVTIQPELEIQLTSDINTLQSSGNILPNPLSNILLTSAQSSGHKTPPPTLSPVVLGATATSAEPVIIETSRPSVDEVLQSIRPIPNAVGQKVTHRKRKCQKAEILTSTPVKLDQKEKFNKSKERAPKNAGKENKSNVRNITRPPTSKISKGRKAKIATKVSRDYYCTLCKEKYSDPPRETWIECGDCKEWTHEACSTYLGTGSYLCDDCQEI